MRYLIWLIAAPVALVIIAFAVANRGPATVSFSPLPFVLDIPLWAVAVGAVLFGIIVGSIVRWLIDYRWRRLAHARGRRLRAVEKEVTHLRERLAKAEAGKSGSGSGSGAKKPLSPPEEAA